MIVRFLNENGIIKFLEYLQSLREGNVSSPPDEVLTDPETSGDFPQSAHVEKINFKSRLEASLYFNQALEPISALLPKRHRGAWSWLSLFYFNQVCPLQADGKRVPGRDYRHIPDTSYRHRHRHLIAGPYSVFQLHGEKARLLLGSPLHKENHFHHQIASRQNLITNPNIMEALDILYFDQKTQRPKRGAQNQGTPGCLYRFIDIIQQLDVTYDLHSIKADRLISLLPKEFKSWL